MCDGAKLMGAIIIKGSHSYVDSKGKTQFYFAIIYAIDDDQEA